MDVIHFPDDAKPARWSRPVLALGNFDGVHRGHRKILDRVRRVATEQGSTAVVMTFDPHPPRIVRPDKAPALLMTIGQKLETMQDAGVQVRRLYSDAFDSQVTTYLDLMRFNVTSVVEGLR